jgi:hypothetical protein
MEILLIAGLLAGIGYWTFKYGKRIGSRLAYRVGRRHGRRLKRHPSNRLR